MSWKDEPTYAQLETISRWLKWRLPTPIALAATQYLKTHANRQETSKEMQRIKKLYDTHTLNEETAFSTPIWRNFNEKGAEK